MVIKVKKAKKATICDRSQALRIAKYAGKCQDFADFIAFLASESQAWPSGSHWFKYAGKLVSFLGNSKEAKKTPFKVFSKKNSKLPFVNFSTLPLITCPGAGACASFCYSLKAWRYPSAFFRQVQNTLLIRFDLVRIANEFQKLKKVDTVRLYVDGDFDSLRTVSFWFDLIKINPTIQFYGYSKSWDILASFPGEYPANYTLNLSSGGKPQTASVDDMLRLPITRGRYIATKVDESLVTPNRYSNPEYHSAVRESAKASGHAKPFSCPGECGSCVKGSDGKNIHACGDKGRFSLVVIANGIH